MDEVLYAAQNRLSSPAETNSRIRAKLEDGWPENVLKAIIDKTLDAGITYKSVLKAIGGKPRAFQPALAADWCKMSDKIRLKEMSKRRFVATPKMDGLRCLFFLNMPAEGVYSRNMKPLKNLDKHLQALKAVFTEPCIIDGEALSASNDWADSISGAKKAGSKNAMHFYPFDYIPGDEQIRNEFAMTSEERYEHLMDKAEGLSPDLFRLVVRSPHLRTIDDVMEEHRLCASEGWEGIVLHDMDSPYSCKRARSWVKVKEWQSAEFTCIGFFKGSGKHSGRLGGILIEGSGVRSEVGTGFTDRQREEIWANQPRYIGLTAEIKFFEVTPDHSLRFPSFLRWREE